MLGNIHEGFDRIKVRLFLCKPNGDTIAELSEAHNIEFKERLGALDELDFDMPIQLEINNVLQRSRNVDKIKDRYLVRMERSFFYYNPLSLTMDGQNVFWSKNLFVINEIKDEAEIKGEGKHIHCFSVAHELQDKMLRKFKIIGTGKKCIEEAVKEATGFDISTGKYNTNNQVWSLEVDSDYALSKSERNFEVDKKTLIEFLFEVAQSFNAIITFDTMKRVIRMRKPESVGHNVEVGDSIKPRITISYGQYLKKLSKESVSDEMVTTLKPYGKDDINIAGVNAMGVDFIENFDFFMYPFEQDAGGNVIRHSDYMSDELCKALIAYHKKVESKAEEFEALLKDKETLDKELKTLQDEMKKLEDDLAKVHHASDLIRADGQLWYADGDKPEKDKSMFYADIRDGRGYVLITDGSGSVQVGDQTVSVGGSWNVAHKIIK